jgi:hypothetical protein
MANSIDFLKETKTSSTTTPSSSNENQPVKDKPSLFDSLLSNNTINEKSDIAVENKVEPEVKKVEVKVEEVNTNGEVVENKKVENKEETLENKEEKGNSTGSTGSLLDRLILEAKKDSKVVSEESKVVLSNNTISESDITVENKVEPEVKKVEVKVEEVNTNGEVVENKKVENKEETLENKNTSVLLPTDEVIQNINIEKKSFDPIKVVDEKKSLMDQLILKNSNNLALSINPDELNPAQREIISKDLISNIYLSSQKNTLNNQTLFNKNEAVNLLKDGTSVNDIKTSANILDLGLENIEIDQTIDIQKNDSIKKIDIDLATRRSLIDNLVLEKNIKSDDIKSLITKSIDASSALLENSLTLADDAIVTVNSPLSYNIQSKIIGAKQQMSTMMSDIAKQMYENYKPPVTVFRINLNPLELGSIAILMKTDKNNALSISMNVSNNTTLDALVENQNILRNSLNKTFDENTKVNLDFSSSNQNNNQSNNQNNQGNQNRFERQMDTQSILQLKEENRDIEEKIIDYM